MGKPGCLVIGRGFKKVGGGEKGETKWSMGWREEKERKTGRRKQGKKSQIRKEAEK